LSIFDDALSLSPAFFIEPPLKSASVEI